MVPITEHALRFLGRVKGIDLDAARAEMQCPALDAAVATGAHYVRRGDGTRLVIREGVVTTVLPPMTTFRFIRGSGGQ